MPAQLQQASFRGVPFAVTRNEQQFGRRVAQHVYPGRDMPWAEDMGRAPMMFRVEGFLLDNDQVYSGGLIADQRQKMQDAANAAGSGTLVHPTMGNLTVLCRQLSMSEPLTASTVSEITFDFVEAGTQQYPNATENKAKAIGGAAHSALGSIAADFQKVLATVSRASALLNLPAVALQYLPHLSLLASDATSLLGLTALLPGNFGRFFAGANAGFLASNASPYAADITVEDLIVDAAGQRATIALAAFDLIAGMTGDPSDIPPFASSVVSSIVGASADPADAMRLLDNLIAVTPTGASAMSDEGAALGDLIRRNAVIALAQVSSVYQPSSYNDAFGTMTSVCATLDAEITLAGDAGLDDSFIALTALRTAVVADLRSRGAQLAPIRTFTVASPLPAAVLAQRFYRNAARADELVKQISPINPLFCPTVFEALAA